jgi:bla regulator protein blaR1
METLSILISKSIALTVIHSLWQGAVIVILTAILIFFLAKKSPKLKYNVYCMALIVFCVSTLFTFLKIHQQVSIINKVENFVSISSPNANINPLILATTTASNSVSLLDGIKNYILRHLQFITILWLMGLMLSFIYLVRSLNQVDRLKRNVNFLSNNYWQNQLNIMASSLGIRKSIQLVESKLTLSPIVIGHLKPIILFPIGFINNLSTEEVEAILFHELAHIKRNDYLINILITFAQSLFYYHPAIWWLNAQIKKERENCCDDIAVELCGNKLTYAKSLVTVQTLMANSQQLAMGISGQGFKSNLGKRISRLLSPKVTTNTSTEKYIGLSLVVALLISAGVMAQIKKFTINQKNSQVETQQNNATLTPPEDSITKLKKTNSGNFDFTETETGKRIKFVLENGTISKLSVDGKLVSSSEYKNYEPKIISLLVAHNKMMDKMETNMSKAEEDMKLAELEMAKNEAQMRESEKQMRLSELEMLENEKKLKVSEEALRLNELNMLESEKQMKKQEKLMQLHELDMKQHEKQMQLHELDMKRQEKLMKEQEIAMKKQEVEMKKWEKETNQILAAWDILLTKEKLWTKNSKHFKITHQAASIEGKAIPSAIHQQLLLIYKNINGNDFETNRFIELTGEQINKPKQMEFGKIN